MRFTPSTPHRPELRLEHIVDEFGLMAAMESPDADMRDANLKVVAIILRLAHRWGQLQQTAAIEASHRLGPQSSPPKTCCA